MYSNDDLTRDILNKLKFKINQVIKQFSLTVISNDNHIINRLKERDLNNMDLRTVLTSLYKKQLPDFIYLALLPENKRPFKIEVKNKDIIIAMSRIDEYTWKINTVLDPKIHSKHEKTGVYQRYINEDPKWIDCGIPHTGDMVKW